MYVLTDRVRCLREDAVNTKQYAARYALEREVYFTLGSAETRGRNLSKNEVLANALASCIENSRAFIFPGELLAGVNYSNGAYGEYAEAGEDNADCRRMLADCGISDETADAYFAARPYRYNEALNVGSPDFTKAEQQAQAEWAAIGRSIDSNHSVIGYEKVLKLGFEGLLTEIERYEKANGTNKVYKSMRTVCEAACGLGEKYARKAQELLDANAEGYNTDDLKFIRDVCGNVPRHPARNFAEAVQALWFAHIINTWEDHINANSLGHLDWILYPYYKKDIENGILTPEKAFEIICCFWIKLYLDYDVQQSCVGGSDADGNPRINDLSSMMLEATEQLNFIRCMSVRFCSRTPKAFIEKALRVVGKVQKGVPFFFNDDVMIPALESKGIPHEDAVNYTEIGCVETVIPGKSNPHAVCGETNLLKAIEYTLCNGRSMMYPEYKSGVQTGEIREFDTYEKFYAAVIRQIENLLELTCGRVKKCREISRTAAPKPYKSLLTEGCIESGRDFNDEGAEFDYYQIMLAGVPNLADSLIAIKTLVYDEHRYTLEQVKDILEADFPDETVRLEWINKLPKFGNDIEEVDSIAAAIVDKSCDILDGLQLKYGMSFHAQPFTFLWMIDHGRNSAASPDGRHKGEIIAYSVSPMQGRDNQGLTALLNSISRLPTKRTPGTSSAIVEIDPKLFTDENLPMLADILMAAGSKGLSNVQFNTIDAATLIAAQRNPEHYNNLAVRVSGFSQKFNLLGRELQDHIIGRTKHACL